MDVKKMIEKLIDEIQKDGNLGTQFKKDPVKVIENIIGKDLPDDALDKVDLDKVGDVAGALKKLF